MTLAGRNPHNGEIEGIRHLEAVESVLLFVSQSAIGWLGRVGNATLVVGIDVYIPMA